MSQGPLCPNLSQKVQKEVSQMANRNLSPVILLGGLSVNLNHLKMTVLNWCDPTLPSKKKSPRLMVYSSRDKDLLCLSLLDTNPSSAS